MNALRYTGRKIEEATLVCSGAGAAAIACLNQLLDLGLKRENVTVCDSKGVIYKTREDKDRMDESKQFYAIEDNGQRVLADAVKGKDIFLGLSGANLLTHEMLNTMNEKPIVFAMANPNPEILPPLAKETRPDVVIGTGRSDFPNQVNNVLWFGAEYLIPTPFDSRLLPRVASATAKAAMESGVATRPIADLDAYAAKLAAWEL